MKKIKLSKNLGHTWFIDLDGTILKHNGYLLDQEDTILKGVKTFFKKIPKKDKIILTTSRNKKYLKKTMNYLKKQKIRFDQIITDLPYGERVLINDIKPNSKSDIKLLLDHSSDKVLASFRAGSLLLKEDNIGLYYEGRLDTRISHANDAYLMAKNGLITNSSFGFQVIEDDWVVSENADDPVVRHLTNVKLHEVSMVAFPAYQDSSVTALRTIRNLSEKSGLKEEELLEAIKDNQLRNLLIDANDIDDEGSVVFNKQKRNRTLVLLDKKADRPKK